MKKWSLFFGLIFIGGLGALSHFAYDFFKVDYLKAIFPANESIFEHLKLFILPSIIYMILDLLIINRYDKAGVFSAYTSGIIVASVFMITAYYTYSGIIGTDNQYVNIGIFVVCVIIIMFYRYKKITLFDGFNSVIAFIVYLIIIEIFTFYPTNINLFLDPHQIEALSPNWLNLFR